MSPEQKRMVELIKSFTDFTTKLENKHEGIFKLAYNDKVKKLERKCDELYDRNNLQEFIVCLNEMRNCFLSTLNTMQQVEMKL